MKKQSFLTALTAVLVFSMFLFALAGCQREVDGGPGGGIITPGVNDNIMVTAGMRGTVIDENGMPVQGATVTSGTQTTTTDRYGAFRFRNISMSKANAYVKVNKTGYFTGMRTFVATEGRTHNVRIRLLPRSNSGTFSSAAGGTITLAGGAKLVMPANAVVDAGGATYNGTVNIAMTWIDPGSPRLSEIMVGDLRGITTAGEERGLETFGMLGVEMTTPGGQALKIATGKTAELTFPIPASLSVAAPATIDLWHFDEIKGRWIQEGAATKTGNNYIAQVSHFSFWNCDAPFPLVNLCMTLVNSTNNQPLNNVQVRIKRSNGSYGSGWTDSLGNLCGKVPKNEALVLQVMDLCNNVAFSQNIGPFSADATLGSIPVTLPSTNSLIITGTVTNCAGSNVTDGAAIVYVSGAHSYVAPVSNGSFTLTLVRCGNDPLNFSVIGIDNVAAQQSVPVSGSGSTGNVNIGTIQACGTSTAQFAEFMIDGNVYTFNSPPDQFGCGDTTGLPLPYTVKTSMSGFKATGNLTMGSFGINFSHNNAVGTLPLTYARIQWTMAIQGLTLLNASPVVNITALGPSPGGFIEGNFSEMMNVSGTPKLVNCNFRIRRN